MNKSTVYPERAKRVERAGFWIRQLALFVDWFLIIIIYAAAAIYLIDNSKNVQELVANLLLFTVFFWVPFGYILTGFLYFPYFTYKFGGPVGKLIVGLRVTDNHGALLAFKRSLFRHTVGYAFSACALGLGFAAVARDPEKKGWHDHATGTKVVITQNRWWLGLIVLSLAILANAYLWGQVVNKYQSSSLKSEISTYINNGKARDLTNPSTNQEVSILPDETFNTEYYQIADLLNSNKNYEARERGNKLLETADIEEEQALVFNLLSQANYGIKEPKLALEFSQKAYEILPENAPIVQYLAFLEYEQGNLRQAEIYVKQDTELEPENAYGHHLYSRVLYEQYKDEQAIEEAKKAVDLEPGNDSYRDYLNQIKK